MAAAAGTGTAALAVVPATQLQQLPCWRDTAHIEGWQASISDLELAVDARVIEACTGLVSKGQDIP